MTSKCKTIKAQRNNGSDKYQTPAYAVAPLVPYIHKEWRIWEPTADQEALVLALRKYGFDVIGTSYDFLSYEPSRWDCIVTNPPYSRKNDFLRRCYELGKPFAMIMPLTALESSERQALYEKYGIEILLLNKRIHFIVPEGVHKSSPWFATAWFCWKMLPKAINFGTVTR